MNLSSLSNSDLKRHLANTHQLLEWLKPAYAPTLEQRYAELWDESQYRQRIASLPVKSKPIVQMLALLPGLDN